MRRRIARANTALAPYRKAIAAFVGVAVLITARYVGQPLPGLDVFVVDLIRDALLGASTVTAVYQVANKNV